jgi:type II pantothenate kinase
MSHFCLLRDPESYRPLDWNLLESPEDLQHWIDVFDKQLARTLEHATGQYGKAAEPQIQEARKIFGQKIQALRTEPGSLGRDGKLDIIDLDYIRENTLHEVGLHDPYRKVKTDGTDKARDLYPHVVRLLHAQPNEDKWLYLIKSCFAGNYFDLGSHSTMHLDGDPESFLQGVEDMKERPWLVDDFDRLQADLLQSVPAKWGKAVIFVDNAGADFVLGVMPFARELTLMGVMVVLAANEKPALNDMTADETVDTVQRLAAQDPDLEAMIEAGMFEVASTGNDIPLIDLSEVSDELNEACADADLVVLEGMGRAVETNYDAQFTVDCLQLAMLKDPLVAQRLGGESLDLVCRYRTVDEA